MGLSCSNHHIMPDQDGIFIHISSHADLTHLLPPIPSYPFFLFLLVLSFLPSVSLLLLYHASITLSHSASSPPPQHLCVMTAHSNAVTLVGLGCQDASGLTLLRQRIHCEVSFTKALVDRGFISWEKPPHQPIAPTSPLKAILL